jgi:aryl-alcohol dehydrogenase-like predicted oxidoreductase
MIYRDNNVLGKPLSRVVFGGAAISGEGGGYGFGNMDEEKAEKILKIAWDSGINFFDTAPIYGFGLSEERFGRYLPKEAVIVSKAGVDWHPSRRVNMSNDPKIVEKMLLESLKRLRRDFIDVYMIHWPDINIDIRRPLEVLRKYQEKSVIGQLGLCNTNLDDLKLSQEVAPITFVQSELNVLNTQSFDRLQDDWKNYFSMGWGTFDKGILSGTVTQARTFDASDARSWAPWWNKKEVSQKIEKVQKLKTILVDYHVSLSQFCLNYSLNHYGLASCLIGIKTLDHLNDVQSHLQHPLEEQTMKEVINRWNN